MQNPCFLEVTEGVALQNIENNEVPCKIFLAKELRDISASTGSFRLIGGAKRMCWTVIGRKSSGIIVRQSGEIFSKDLPFSSRYFRSRLQELGVRRRNLAADSALGMSILR
jgi:hypothetical protein